jgi:hypothetical protein
VLGWTGEKFSLSESDSRLPWRCRAARLKGASARRGGASSESLAWSLEASLPGRPTLTASAIKWIDYVRLKTLKRGLQTAWGMPVISTPLKLATGDLRMLKT